MDGRGRILTALGLLGAGVVVAVVPGQSPKPTPAEVAVERALAKVVHVDAEAGVAIWGAGTVEEDGRLVGSRFDRCYVAGAVHLLTTEPHASETPLWRRAQWAALALELAPLPAWNGEECKGSPYHPDTAR